MKVLFAVGDSKLSKNISERYYEKFGETLEYKDVFYFKSLLDEVKRNKTYNVIVINEDLEQYKVNDIEQLNRKLFSDVDSITDEAQDADIIYIGSNMRTKDDPFIVRLYSIGIYNILLGEDRNIGPLCEIIKRPKTKREAKEYLNIDSTAINETGIMRDDEVDEGQMMNILNYYERIKDEPEKYVETFDRISSQYSRAQLKVIASWLPKNVQEAIYNEPKYKFLLLFDGQEQKDVNTERKNVQDINVKKVERKHSQDFLGVFKKNTEKIIKNISHKSKTEETTINEDILKARNAEKARIEADARRQQELAEKHSAQMEEKSQEQAEKIRREAEERSKIQVEQLKKEAEDRRQQELLERAKREAEARTQQELEERAKRENESKLQQEMTERTKREAEAKLQQELAEKARREAEAKAQQELAERAKREAETINQQELVEKLQSEEIIVDNNIRSPKIINANISVNENLTEAQLRFKEAQEKLAIEQERLRREQAEFEAEKRRIMEAQERLEREKSQFDIIPQVQSKPTYEAATVTSLNYKKMVVFVGANKAGTTFMVNSIAHELASQKALTSILDITRDKSMYYIYNQGDNDLRQIAGECMQRLSNGEDYYIPVSKYLKVYTTIPGGLADTRRSYKHKTIIETVKENCNVVIIDADFTTPIDYFESASEIYIVQDMDILKIQDTTMFLREMKNRNMDMSKIKVVINKYVKNSLTPKIIIEGLSYYKDPEMTFIDTLLGNKVMYTVVPYNLNNYVKYTESLYKGVMNFKGYTTDFTEAINDISNQIISRGGNVKKNKGGFFG